MTTETKSSACSDTARLESELVVARRRLAEAEAYIILRGGQTDRAFRRIYDALGYKGALAGVDLEDECGPGGHTGKALAERAAELVAKAEGPIIARPIAEYHEDMGNMLWHCFPIDEPPYCGMPHDSDWPGYHTHFTPLPDCNRIVPK